MTLFLREGGLALNSQGDDIKKHIPASGAMLASTVGSCSCVNPQRFLENPHMSYVKVTSRRMEQCAQSVLFSTDHNFFFTHWRKSCIPNATFVTRCKKSCERKFEGSDCETQF